MSTSNISVFNQSMDWLDDRASRLSRQAFQWLRPLVDRINFLTGVAVVPPKGVVWANLSAADITAYFTAGLGNAGDVYEGWAICDGSNGTPNLADRFVRAKVTGSGATGGSDSSAHTHAVDHDHAAFTSATESGHTHAIDHDHGAFTSATESGHTHAIDHDHAAFTSATESGHTHAIDHDHPSFTSAGESGHTHAAGTLVASLTANSSLLKYEDVAGSFTRTHTLGATGLTITSSSGSETRSIGVHGTSDVSSGHTHSIDVPALTGTSGASSGHTHSIDPPALTGTSGASSGHTHSIDVPAITQASGASSGHTHSIDVPAITATSGAASATENRPAYYELVPLMRVWT